MIHGASYVKGHWEPMTAPPYTSPHSDVGRTGPIPGLSGGSWPRILRRYPANISTPSESDPGLQRVHRSVYSPMTSRSWSGRATARET